VNDFQATVRARDVSGYLASKGWERDGDRNGASVWRLGNQARLLVPDLQAYDDADELIHAAVAKIARYEARPELAVWQDIAEPAVDAQFYRLHPAHAPAGSIPLPEGFKAARSIHNLLRFAATATEQGPGTYFEGNRSAQVNTFLHRVLLGSAAPGSYILTARIPAAPAGQQQLDFMNGAAQEFSGRAVMAHLHSALEATRAAAASALRDRGDLGAFYESVEQGVSANLCEALSDLGGEQRNQPFEIGFSWARAVPAQRPAQEVKFTGAMPQILAMAAGELVALARSGTARITGTITDLHDERNEPSRIKVKGELRVSKKENFPRRPIWVVLGPADYQTAIDAHRRGRHVAAEGHLTTTRRRLELRADTFQVLPPNASHA
jgi:hypothetical protein